LDLPNPKGIKGRLVPHRPYFWGIWQFAQNKSAAKDLIEFLCQREQMEALTTAVSGYDIPPYLSMSNFKVWAEVEPPKARFTTIRSGPGTMPSTTSPVPLARRRSACRCGIGD